MKQIFFVITSLIIVNLIYVNGEACTTYDGSNGNCVSIYGCPSLMQLLRKADRSAADVDLLRKSTCGFEGKTPKVCCPNLCMTPSGEQGKCVQRSSCLHLCKDCEVKSCPGSDNSICCGPLPNQKMEYQNCRTTVTAYPPDPHSYCCGSDSATESSYILGDGLTAQLDQYSWLTLIEYQSNNTIKMLCGGVLISGKYVLTAAHCLQGKIQERGTPVNVRLGEYDVKTDFDCVKVEQDALDCMNETISIPIEHTIVHPQYDPATKRNDIALIRLKNLAPYTDFIRPICLPTKDYTLSPPPYFRLVAAGWGVNSTHLKSSIKLFADLPFVKFEDCQRVYSSRNVTLWNGQLCAGGESGKDSCRGDSGGPLMYQHQISFEAVGLSSFVPSPCGVENFPAVYTKVYEYNDWIYSNIKP